jgi:hypothetical protein
MDNTQIDKLDHSELMRHTYPEDHIDSENGKYIGEFSDGQKSGYGILLYENGNKYLGQFKNNKFCGEGIFYFANGDILQGTFVNNLLSGLSRFKSKKGYEYYGYWVDGKKNGWGRMRNQTAWAYDSETYIPESYDGKWLDNVFHGEGLYINEKIKYYGNWELGVKTGYGKLQDEEYNYIYDGYFINDKFEGHGVLTFSDKSFYNGKFKNGKPNGYGFYQDINKIKHYGDWVDGHCGSLLNKYLEEFIDRTCRKEFDKLIPLKSEWDVLFQQWRVHSSTLDKITEDGIEFVKKLKTKLQELNIQLAKFDQIMEEDIDHRINYADESNIRYFCCDYPILWGYVPDIFSLLEESSNYKNRNDLYQYYLLISDELKDHDFSDLSGL